MDFCIIYYYITQIKLCGKCSKKLKVTQRLQEKKNTNSTTAKKNTKNTVKKNTKSTATNGLDGDKKRTRTQLDTPSELHVRPRFEDIGIIAGQVMCVPQERRSICIALMNNVLFIMYMYNNNKNH